MAVTQGTRVLIADDHTPTRALIRRAVEKDGFVVCAEVPDALEAIKVAREESPDIVLLDIRMPGNGLYAAEIIRTKQPSILVVMLTVSTDDADLFSALAVGASGYWLKGQSPATIPHLLRRVMAGETVLTGVLIKRLVKDWSTQSLYRQSRERLSGGARLTQRECEVVDLLIDGLNTGEIGKRLFVSEVTVRTHIANVVKKLKVEDRDAAVQSLRRWKGSTNPNSVQ
jgi:two-component system, NarL family, nitrate/nitrite response regulator NarL